MSLRDIFLGILFALIWGLNYVVMKFTTHEVPGFLAASIRFTLTSLVLLPFARKIEFSWKSLYFASLSSGAYISLIYYGMYLGINTCLGIILMQLNALFSIFIAKIVLGERFTYESLLGIAIALVGIVLVVGNPDNVGNYKAVFIILLAAFCCAIFSIQSKQLNKISPISLIQTLGFCPLTPTLTFKFKTNFIHFNS